MFFYVPTAISINFQDTMHAMVFHCYVVTSISSNFQDALDVTFQETFQSTSRTLWMLRCNIQFEQLGRRLGWINFQDTLDATVYLKGWVTYVNWETSQHMPPCPPLNPSPPKCPLVPRLNPKGLSNICQLRDKSTYAPMSPPKPQSP